MQFNKSAFWKSRNIIRHQQKVYTSKTLLQLVKSEIESFKFMKKVFVWKGRNIFKGSKL
jgi:exopolysaccharide biosynthesis predicted pyruvyltransferase EpsI